MSYRLKFNSEPYGPSIIDEQTGENIMHRMGVKEIAVYFKAGKDPRLEVTLLLHAELSGIPQPRWYAADPSSGIRKALSAVIFADGSRVDLSAAGLTPFCSEEPETT